MELREKYDRFFLDISYVIGVIIGAVACILVDLEDNGLPRINWFDPISWIFYAFIGGGVCLFVMFVIQIIKQYYYIRIDI